MTEHIPITQLLLVFSSLFVLGTLATLPLFAFKLQAFVHSSLFVKIALWIPIFMVFVAVLYAPNPGRLAVLIGIASMACLEAWRVAKAVGKPRIVGVYVSVILVALAHFVLVVANFPQWAISLLITMCFASVLSDVCAFFFGKYLGRHHLPAALNSNKSWEGVVGQLVGAAVGVMVVHIWILPVVAWWIFIPLGVGSALGDLYNSYTKRQLGIKDWSQNLPGHGGYLDRLASLAVGIALTFYGLLLI
jgi:CDP-diglyceride synthetase